MPDLEPVAVPVLEPQVLHDAAAVFGLLSATARLQIMWLLASGPRDVGTLAADLGQPVAAVSQHLAKLKRRPGRRRGRGSPPPGRRGLSHGDSRQRACAP